MGYGGHAYEALSRLRLNKAKRHRKKEIHNRIEEIHNRIPESRVIHPEHFKDPSPEELEALKADLSSGKLRHFLMIAISIMIALGITIGLALWIL